MSRKSDLKAALVAASRRAGGAHLTLEARDRTARVFSTFVSQSPFSSVQGPDSISGRVLRGYVEFRINAGLGIRSVQNEVAHLRVMMRNGGGSSVCDAKEQSNRALGISGGSRTGKKVAITDEALKRIDGLNVSQARPGMLACLRLGATLGLRINEALHAKDDTLARWIREASVSDSITVSGGTKGGRPRVVTIHERAAAVALLTSCLEIARRQNGFLVVRRDGSPTGGLKQARSIVNAWMRRQCVNPHAARYRFAQNQRQHYLAAGYSVREMLQRLVLDLGHGTSRARYVKSVYLK